MIWFTIGFIAGIVSGVFLMALVAYGHDDDE